MAEQPTTSDPSVFLSYTTPDRERVLALAEDLAAAGIRVWVDRRDLVGGSSWDASIVDAISRCTVFALTCSSRSLASPNVQQEVRLAWEEQRPILPLMLESVVIPRELRYPLAGRQWVEVLDRPQEAWLSDVLRALAGLGIAPLVAHPVAAIAATPSVLPSLRLPIPLTSLIGREQELAELAALLDTSRLLTLTGPGGIGKTRLAIEAARRCATTTSRNAVFVPLAAVTDPNRVAPAIAQALDLREVEGRAAVEALQAYLQPQRLVLVLDNFEQIATAASLLVTLLEACPDVTLLVTSRAPLHVSGEQEFALPLLPLPAPARVSTPESLAGIGAVELFVQRAQAANAHFNLTAENATAIAAIVRRLDGLPLAIELAAARTKLLPPQALYERLQHSLKLLTGGDRNHPAHQQTLRATIAWSFDLLTPSEKVVFRQLAVFADGCTLAAAEAVCNAAGDPGIDVFDDIMSLTDKSLLRQSTEAAAGVGPRFTMLATIHEFAVDQLAASGELAAVWEAFVAYVVKLVAGSGQRLRGSEQGQVFAEVEAERNNLRALVVKEIECGRTRALDFVEPLLFYWWLAGYGDEARRWTETLLTMPEAAEPGELRARLLSVAGVLRWANTQLDQAAILLTESVAIWRERAQNGGTSGNDLAYALSWLQISTTRRMGTGLTLGEESLALFERLGDTWGAAFSRVCLALASRALGDESAAQASFQIAASAFGTLGDRWWQAIAVFHLGRSAYAVKDNAMARLYWRESLPLFIEFGDKHHIAGALLATSHLMRVDGDPIRAARLLGAEEMTRRVYGVPRSTATYGASYESHASALRAVLGAECFATAWADGQALSIEAAMADALAGLAATRGD